ncbi:MAG: metallophosphoesterase family protein [bacterium]|nr:metallophosphoesterase family protein [bacterium]
MHHGTHTDILIVSDIHLGSPVCRSKALLRFLKTVKFRTLILNGDIFDDLNFNRLSHDDWELLAHLRELSKLNHHTAVIWIAGNHDGAAATLSRLIGVPVVNEYVFYWNGTKCLAIHGHQFDRFLSKNIVISTIAGAIYLAIQRIDGQEQHVARLVKRFSKSWLRVSAKVMKGAVRYNLVFKRAAYVFCGHTHKEHEEVVHGVEYLNSGCWTDIPSAYITLDEQGARVHTIG